MADGGGYAYTSTKVLGNATLMCTGPYEIPNVKVDSYAVYTNNMVTGAFRGFGGPQGAFAAETQMNRLAEGFGHRPGGDPPAQCIARRLVALGRHAASQRRQPAGGDRSLRRRSRLAGVLESERHR